MSATQTESALLQPGQSIKPNVSAETAKQLIRQEFGFTVTRLKELNSYDDINYFVEAVSARDASPGKFVFKILNSMDSRKTGHVEAENACMLHLSSNGFNCPVPQRNMDGKLFSIVTVPGGTTADSENNVTVENVHVIRLLSFVEGDILANIPLTKSLLFDAGVYLARMDNTLMNFSHPALVDHHQIWQMFHVPNLRLFTFIVEKDPHRFQMVQSILKAFDERIVPEYPNLEKGIIHGDFNEQNILVRRAPTDNGSGSGDAGYKIHGVIDFGDMHISHYFFELGILLCYMMIESFKIDLDPLESSGYALAGYMTKRKVSELELKLLRTCICARLCQSLVMGAYTHSLDEGNTYLLTTSARGWALMNKIWIETTDEQILSVWKRVLDAGSPTN